MALGTGSNQSYIALIMLNNNFVNKDRYPKMYLKNIILHKQVAAPRGNLRRTIYFLSKLVARNIYRGHDLRSLKNAPAIKGYKNGDLL